MRMHTLTSVHARTAVVAIGLAGILAAHPAAQTAAKWDDAIAKFEQQDKVSPPPTDGIVFKTPHTQFMDIEAKMLGADGKPNPDLLVADGLHMTPADYRIWTAALKPMLQ